MFFIESLRDILELPSLSIDIRKEWNSCTEDYRLLIRKKLLEDLDREKQFFSREEKNKILNLNLIPKIKGQQISISHCKLAGGFTFHSGEESLGLDIENSKRIKDKHVERVLYDQEEWKECPSASSLWVAKEAAYKATSFFGEISVLSELKIGAWQKNQNYELFRLLQPSSKVLSSIGCIWSYEDIKVALFKIQPALEQDQ